MNSHIHTQEKHMKGEAKSSQLKADLKAKFVFQGLSGEKAAF